MNIIPKCDKCFKTFSNYEGLKRHNNKQILCDRIIECKKCHKQFPTITKLNLHNKRITRCDPVIGDTTKTTPPDTCHFCGRSFNRTSSLTRHFNTCKIKNGGMRYLFDTIKKQQEQIDDQNKILLTLVKKQTPDINGNENVVGNGNNIIKNHFNTILNIQLIGFDSEENNDKMIQIIKNTAFDILSMDIKSDIPTQKQVFDRLLTIAENVYRNPEYKELQNVYVADPIQDKENAFTYDDGKWNIGDWNKVSKNLLQKIYNILYESKLKKYDSLQVIKHIFVLSGFSDDSIHIAEDNSAQLYNDLGIKLGFNTIIT
jgi:hypothetical protein